MKKLNSHPGYTAINKTDVVLDGDLEYENDSHIIRVYKGFVTDGGSIPRISWTLLGITPFDPRCVYAFFLHDWLYQSEIINRADADAILYEVLGIPPSCSAVQRYLIWSHVRAYGWLVWRNHTLDTIAEGRKFGEVVEKKKLHRDIIGKYS